MPRSDAARLPLDAEKDLRWLLGFLTLVAAIMYVVVLVTIPEMRQPLRLVAFTALLAVHLLLHWLLLRIPPHSLWMSGYIVIQGVLFLAVTLLCGSPSMIFPLFSALIGEAIGTQGLNRRGLLAAAYFVVLMLVSFFFVFDLKAAGWLSVGTLATVVCAVFYTALYKRQVEARARAQTLLDDLEAANQRLSEYAARVEELTTAAERQRMARELHDTLSQGLAGLVLQLEAAAAHLKGNRSERALAIVQQAMEKARGTLAESRQAIADLRQDAPRDLEEAARQEAERFSSATGIPCAVEIDIPASVPEPVSEAAIRVLAEGLTNVARHAQARSVRLRIARTDASGDLELEICDDGLGFEPAAVEAGHFGLVGMRERVQLAGGRLEVRSASGKGTQLMIRFPLEDAPDE